MPWIALISLAVNIILFIIKIVMNSGPNNAIPAKAAVRLAYFLDCCDALRNVCEAKGVQASNVPYDEILDAAKHANKPVGI